MAQLVICIVKNVFVGFGSLLLRILYGLVFSIINIQRMDIPTLAYVYEGFDAGYGAYVGFHIVQKTHTHPITLGSYEHIFQF